MHWPIIRLIWFREMRDLLRDRRTLFMIFVLPVALYPVLGIVGLTFARQGLDQVSIVGVYGVENLPKRQANSIGVPSLAAAWLSLTPSDTAGGLERVVGTAAFAETVRSRLDYPPLIVDRQFLKSYREPWQPGDVIRVLILASSNRSVLDTGEVDVMLVVPADFRSQLEVSGRSVLDIYYRENNDRSRIADRRLSGILNRWQRQLKVVRFARRGLPADFDQPLDIQRPQEHDQPEHKRLADELADMMAKFFPFLLIMWALAGALHPAIDVTAGEKERATLETLLLSPATRGEIVCGKFLAVWIFSAATALWNLAWLGGGAWVASWFLPFSIMRFTSLFWSAVLTIWMAGLFSALSMALGAYARSTKEGQYYLLPLFVITMPLAMLPLMPGIELNWFYSLVPITGATMLLQKLMNPQTDAGTWFYFVPVLASLIFCCAVSLRWAVAQFRREDVLFRESAGLDWSGWARRWLGRAEQRQPPG
jgi:sodium transport system permease protein